MNNNQSRHIIQCEAYYYIIEQGMKVVANGFFLMFDCCQGRQEQQNKHFLRFLRMFFFLTNQLIINQ